MKPQGNRYVLTFNILTSLFKQNKWLLFLRSIWKLCFIFSKLSKFIAEFYLISPL